MQDVQINNITANSHIITFKYELPQGSIFGTSSFSILFETYKSQLLIS